MMDWLIIVIISIFILSILFVILTDGRYFGKGLMYVIYNRLGPQIFNARSESERWRALAEQLQLNGGENILDVGTATGDLPLTLAALPNFRGKIVGIDWSPKMIAVAQDEARKRNLVKNTEFQTADVRQKLPFRDNFFDVVICFGVLETLPHPEDILTELKRILKLDGKMALSLYRGWSGKSAALSLDWYEKNLKELQINQTKVVTCRRSQDVIIAS